MREYALSIVLPDGTTLAATSTCPCYTMPSAAAGTPVTVSIRAIDVFNRLGPALTAKL